MQQAVVFGCGETAVANRENIHKRFQVIAYSDNNPALWGTEFDGTTVVSPDRIPEDVSIVVASGLYYPEILHGLLNGRAGRNRPYFAVINGEIVEYFPGMPGQVLEFQYLHGEVSLTTFQIGISGHCNSKCRYCEYHSEYRDYEFYQGLMSDEILEEVCRQISSIDTLKTLTFVGSGETLIHPKWADYIARLLEVCPTVEEYVIYTNGMLLTKENVEKLKRLPFPKLRLVLSIDGLSPEDCEYWRKGETFSVIRENVHRAYDLLGQNVDFTLSGCVVLPKSLNAGDAAEVKDFVKHSDRWRREEFPFMNFGNLLAQPLVANIPGTRVVEASVYPVPCSCRNPFNFSAVWANGDILSCPCGYLFEKPEMLHIGNIMTDRLLDVFYHSEVLEELRRELSDGRKPAACGPCSQLGGSTIRCLQRI